MAKKCWNFDWKLYQITDHARVGHQLLSLIPDDPDVPVAASGALIPYLSHRKTVYSFPYPFKKNIFYSKKHVPIQPTYVMIDTSSHAVNRMHYKQQEGFLIAARTFVQHPEYEVFESQDGFVLLRSLSEKPFK